VVGQFPITRRRGTRARPPLIAGKMDLSSLVSGTRDAVFFFLASNFLIFLTTLRGTRLKVNFAVRIEQSPRFLTLTEENSYERSVLHTEYFYDGRG